MNSTTSSSFMWRSTTSPGWGEGETQGERSGGKVRGRKRGREKRSARGQGDMCNSTVPDATDKVEKGLYDNKIYDRIKPIYYIQKNKYGFPFRKVMTEFCLREKRFLNEVNCLAAAEMLGIIERAGNSNWKIQGVNCKGRDTAEQYLHDNPEIEEKIWREIDSRHIELFGTPKSAKSKEALE